MIVNGRSRRASLIPWMPPPSGVPCAGDGLSTISGIACSYWWGNIDH
jgi:hypothetical protein